MTEIRSTDTICAISTAPGVGGIAVVRVSGSEAIEVVSEIWRGRPIADMDSHTVRLGNIVDMDGSVLDQCVLTLFRAPHSFTGDDTIELSIHGSRYLQRRVVDLLIENGARLAEAGEYTRRAFLAGNIDLAQAEAVADVIASNSRAAHRIAVGQMRGRFSKRLMALHDRLLELAALLELELDFSEEEVEFASRTQLLGIATAVADEVSRLYRSFSSGQAIKEGVPVAIVGPTNAGKSSLLNALVGDDRAIVSDVHGTTRDVIEDTLEIDDYLFRFIDTAGLRQTTDRIERIGIDRARGAISKALIVVTVVDSSLPLDPAILEESINAPHRILVLNKVDLSAERNMPAGVGEGVAVIHLSTLTGEGLDELRLKLVETVRLENAGADEDVLVTNARHAQALQAAHQSVERVINGLHKGLSGDFIAQDLRETIHYLSTITGEITTPDILGAIFSRFCIGK